MGTSDTAAAQGVLRCLDEADIEYGLLHGAESVAALEPISDLDVAVFKDPWRIVGEIQNRVLDRTGLRLVMTWEYDVGALTTFWLSDDVTRGVQLDLLHDSKGAGRYGLRTSRTLANHIERSNWPPRLDEDARATYLLSKRLVKGDLPRVRTLVEEFCAPGGLQFQPDLLSEPCRTRAAQALLGRFPRSWTRHLIRWRSRLNVHLADRLRYDTGIVTAAPFTHDGPESASTLASLRQVFAHVTVLDSEPGRLNRWRLTRRPVLALYPNTDSSLEIADFVAAIESISGQRVPQRIGRWDV